MKCYRHPDKEAVGSCSNCGKRLCKKCMETKDEKILCKECLQTKAATLNVSLYNLIGAFLGWLGAINSFAMGGFIVTTYLAIIKLFAETEMLIYLTYIIIILTATLSLILIYGSYLLWKGSSRKGGMLNILGGGMQLFTYIYFTFFSQPSLLKWLGPIGIFLFIPSILSGTIGILTKEEI